MTNLLLSSLDTMAINCDTVKFWLDAAGRYPVLKPEQVLVLARRIQSNKEGSKLRQRAIEKLVTHNLKLIPRIAVRVFSGKHSKLFKNGYLEDIYQSGVIGLTRAAELYDPQKGYAFSTYASAWVYQSMQRYVYNNMSLIRVPENTIREYYSVCKYSPKSALDDVSEKKKERYLDAHIAISCGSLDEMLTGKDNSGDHMTWIDLVPSEHREDIQDSFHELLALSQTSKTSKQMVVDYFEKNISMQEIASTVGISRNRVSEIINECLASIRHNMTLI